MQHIWIPSTLGHGETMCKNCLITNREAMVLCCLDKCEKVPEETQAHLTVVGGTDVDQS